MLALLVAPGRKSDPPIAIDAGHSLNRSGARSAHGLPEYSFNRIIAPMLRDELNASGASSAVLINAAGRDWTPAHRAAGAGVLGARLLISIHHDSVQPQYLSPWVFEGRVEKLSRRAGGFSVFFSGRNSQPEQSLALARAIGESLRRSGFAPTLHHAEKIPGESRELVDAATGVYRNDALAILNHAKMPSVLVECGVIVNPDEESALRDSTRRGLFVAALAEGIRRALGSAW